MKTGLKKVFRDIFLYKGRTLLTLIGIFIGIASVGAVLSSYSILNREMEKNFMDTNPASIVISVSNLDNKAVELIKKSNPNLEIELRKTAQARIRRSDGTYGSIYLRAIQDFNNQKVDTFTLEKGAFPSDVSQMAIERDCLKLLSNIKEGVGERVDIKLPGGLEKEMQLSGRVHAPGLAPASMENYSYGFLSLDGLKTLGYKGWYDEIRIVSYENRLDRTKMELLSANINESLVQNGYAVKSVQVPVPGKHPHADQLSSLLFLLQAFTLISLLAACLITINLINFIMSKQVKQIAIMKAVGASTYDISVPYFLYVIIISTVALLISFPFSIAIGRAYSQFAAGILNFNISSDSVPYWVFLIQAMVGILLPLICTAVPIYKSCTKSVKDGLYEKDLSSSSGKRKGFRKASGFTNSKIIIPIKNLSRKKSRMILAVLALLTGGGLFMTSQNIIASIDKTVDMSMNNFRWDYNITLAGNYPEEKLKKVLGTIDGIDRFEFWGTNAALLTENGSLNSVNSPIKIIPENSQMVNSNLTDKLNSLNGRDTIVVNNGVAKDENWIKPGTTIKVKINGRTADVVVSAIVDEVPALPTVYINTDTFKRLFGGNCGQMILCGVNTRDLSKQRQITKDIETKFRSSGIELVDNWNVYVLRKAFVDHLLIIVTFLTAISMLAVLVGGISIGSAVGINIAERKRETGILRAVGANRRQIVSMVLLEVFISGITSWFLGMALSYPISEWVGNYFGQVFLGVNLQNALSLSGSIQWLVISITVCILAGFLPAWKTATAPLREMLEYE
jgi:putative ABC transport system permease protein